jgi:beta-lactamase regulating signal transducer with metallopeptidase domain
VRYRIHAAAFALTAAVGPLALTAASLRPAPPTGGAPGAPAVVVLLAVAMLVLAAATGVALLIELAVDVVKLRRVKRRAVPLGTVAVRRARIGTSPTVSTPTAIGYVHPAVVLPEGFRARVDDREWDAVVAHECAHLARRDDWAKAAQSAVSRAAWWVPGLWILGRALDLERELASDERAACETGARRYAACLLRLATDRTGGALAPTFAGRRSHVAIRVECLLRPAAGGGPLRRAIALGCFTAAAFAVVAATLVALPGTAVRSAGAVPQRAQIALRHHAPRHSAARIAARIRHHAPVHRSVPTLALAQTPAISVPERVERPAAAVARLAVVAPRSASEPVRRPEPRRAPALRTGAPQAETIAFVAPHLRCRTCFGPLRSPDDAVEAQPPAFTPAAGLPSGAAAAIVAEDPTSGPVSLGSRTIWFRIPVRALPTL